uniref:Uncharacterized protein n=1 Tax=viral metagenome TaxID=1070528 RepID=A0A6C0B317_9ZZZZ
MDFTEERRRIFSEKMARMSIKPQDMFCRQTGLYSSFDSNGIPTHDVSGNEISKCIAKKLKKEWLKQEKLYLSNEFA